MDSKVIDFKARKKEKEKILGKLVWLYCPTCRTIQYTNVLSSNGRTHKCGTLVDEVEVELDLTAEFTIASENLSQLKKMADPEVCSKATEEYLKNLEEFIQSEESYIQKLNAAAGVELKKDRNRSLEELVKEIGAVKAGNSDYYLSPFRIHPHKRFSKQTD